MYKPFNNSTKINSEIMRSELFLCPFCGAELDNNPRRNCRKCNTSDRNRCVKQLYDALAPLLKNLCCLNLTADKAVLSGQYFASIENSIYRGKNHIDIQRIDRPNDVWDFTVCNHVLEHVENDKAAVRELVRTNRKAVQITVPVTTKAFSGIEYGAADPERDGHYRHYGADFGIRMKELVPHCRVLVTVQTDKATGNYDVAYLLVKDSVMAEHIFNLLRDFNTPCVVL
jgi:hypothetical protein